ncbi:hypothetical protein GCM10023191_055250 [Actinoallomurus oryzae]|uniref:Uncharacterized protein n=1 Tax=Actinoallomurus oryzae TaxID=502180 RepID=A0ABP8QH26_9ACTN
MGVWIPGRAGFARRPRKWGRAMSPSLYTAGPSGSVTGEAEPFNRPSPGRAPASTGRVASCYGKAAPGLRGNPEAAGGAAVQG